MIWKFDDLEMLTAKMLFSHRLTDLFLPWRREEKNSSKIVIADKSGTSYRLTGHFFFVS